MSNNGYKSTKPKAKYVSNYNKTNIMKDEAFNINNQYNNVEDNPELFSKIYDPECPGRIIHQSTEHSFDDQGNRVVTTKTVREIDSLGNKIKSTVETKKSYTSKTSQASKPEKQVRITKYTNAKNEVEKQRALYSSPDFQSGSQYDTPPVYMNNMKNPDDFYEDG